MMLIILGSRKMAALELSKIEVEDDTVDELEGCFDHSNGKPQKYFIGKKTVPVISNTSNRFKAGDVVRCILTSEAKVSQVEPFGCTETKAFIIGTTPTPH